MHKSAITWSSSCR